MGQQKQFYCTFKKQKRFRNLVTNWCCFLYVKNVINLSPSRKLVWVNWSPYASIHSPFDNYLFKIYFTRESMLVMGIWWKIKHSPCPQGSYLLVEEKCIYTNKIVLILKFCCTVIKCKVLHWVLILNLANRPKC